MDVERALKNSQQEAKGESSFSWRGGRGLRTEAVEGKDSARPSTLWHLMSISALPEKQGHQIFTKAALNINLQDADV